MLTGVRGRAAAALAVVSIVSIGILALILLRPLEQRLRADELESLVQTGTSARTRLSRLSSDHLRPGDRELRRAVGSIRRATSADVAIVDERGRVLVNTDPDAGEPLANTRRAIASGRIQRGPPGADATEAQVAIPVVLEDQTFALALSKPLDESRSAARVVRRAFLEGAAISLCVALLLGFLLARGLSRRLTALRDTALRVAEIGPVAEMRSDSARDEVGDLTRAFASMQHRLGEQEKARRAFVATASHELRTPLSSLQIMLDILRSDLAAQPPDVDDARMQAERAEAQAERLSGLAGELLDLSRIDAGVALRTELVELGESARATIAEFDVRAEESGAELVIEAQQPLWAVADPGAVAQILRILVDNALGYGIGRPVRVAVAAADGEATVAVVDSGPGVAPEDRDRIFERFERGASSSGAGFGLGLAIARELARRMGGELSLDAATSGGRFVLRLPLAPAH